MPSTPQEDLDDDLLVDYLAALDLYQAAQDRLALSLKQVCASATRLLSIAPSEA